MPTNQRQRVGGKASGSKGQSDESLAGRGRNVEPGPGFQDGESCPLVCLGHEGVKRVGGDPRQSLKKEQDGEGFLELRPRAMLGRESTEAARKPSKSTAI